MEFPFQAADRSQCQAGRTITLVYPMDEMNAPAATGIQASTEAQPAPSSEATARPEHRIPPPIFFSPY
jgi:hypothetical protein